MQDETTYHYDQIGLLSRAENNSAVVAFKRDALGRIISETLNGREVTSTYDCCGNRTAREIGGPYPPPTRGNLAFKYDTMEAQAAQNCPIRFQGQWEDAETGLYYNRYRYYDPLAAQYLSPDPIGLAGGLRSNGYVHNPNAWIDPWGLAKAKECCFSFSSYENARNASLKKIDELGGIDPASRVNHINKGLGNNPAKGLVDGFTAKMKNGKTIEYRLDYDEINGTHINLIIGKGETALNHANYFPGSQSDYLNLLRQFQR